MQNEVMQQGGTRQGRASTDGAASVITRAEALAYELTIQEVMTGKIKAVTPDLPMVDVLDLMREARVTGAPVVVDGDLVGIVSVVAVGALLELSAVIITKNATPDEGLGRWLCGVYVGDGWCRDSGTPEDPEGDLCS